LVSKNLKKLVINEIKNNLKKRSEVMKWVHGSGKDKKQKGG
jgi:hypothetical protein